MKTNNRFLSILAVLTGFIFLTSCVEWTIVKKSKEEIVKPTITLKVVNDTLEIKGKHCVDDLASVEGCVKVGKWNIALITFKLKDSPDYYFNKFEICEGSTADDLVGCELEKWEQVEVFATDKKAAKYEFPDAGGVINLKNLATDLTKFYLFDYNSVKQKYYYRITVCKSDGTSCKQTDPPVDNDGRGGHRA